MKITFNKNVKSIILKMFGKTVDDENYIIDNDTKVRTQTLNGEEIHVEKFGGIRKGSEIFLK